MMRPDPDYVTRAELAVFAHQIVKGCVDVFASLLDTIDANNPVLSGLICRALAEKSGGMEVAALSLTERALIDALVGYLRAAGKLPASPGPPR